MHQGFKLILTDTIPDGSNYPTILVMTSGFMIGSQLPSDNDTRARLERAIKTNFSKRLFDKNVKIDLPILQKTEYKLSDDISMNKFDEGGCILWLENIQLFGTGTIGAAEIERTYIKAYFENSVLIPGDTVNVIVKKVDKDGNEFNFPEHTQYEVGLKEGCDIGKILTSSGQLGNYFFNITKPIRFVVNDSLTVDSAYVVLRVGVPQDNDTIYLPYSSFVQNNSKKSQTAELLHSKVGNNLNTLNITSEYCTTNPFEYQAYGLAVGIIKPGDCSNVQQCDSPPQTPTFNVSDHPNGYLGYDVCESEFGNRSGGFHPLLDNFESAFEPYALKLCYNPNADRWQIAPHENTISIRAIVAECYEISPIQRELFDVSEINNIPEDELCEALVSINKHFRYPIAVTPNIHFYWLREVVYAHEFEHLNVFRDSTTHLALKEKVSLDGKEYSNFEEAIKSFNISCDQISDVKMVEKEAYSFYRKTLEKVLPSILKQHNKVAKSTEENIFHSRRKIQDTVKKYSTAIDNRLKILKINCDAN